MNALIDVVIFIILMYCMIAFFGRICYEEGMDEPDFIDV